MTREEILQFLKEYKSTLLEFNGHTYNDYGSARTYLVQNRPRLQRILIECHVLKRMSIAPPPLTGGYVMNNVNPLDVMFDPPYGLDIIRVVADVIDEAIGVVNSDDAFKIEKTKSDGTDDYDIWRLMHPSITELAKPRMKNFFYADAVEAAFKVVNMRVKDLVEAQTGEELDGANLMRKAFSPNNPIINIGAGSSHSGNDIQKGYMDIFAGAMTGIRNPKAHGNETISKEDAYRKLILASMLLYKIDERVITE